MATDTSVRPRKRNDAYTGLLAVSFLALVGGCVLLYLDLEQYKEGENLKKAPDPIKIDVPGAQLKIVPGSGTPPKPKPVEPEPMPMPPDPMMPPPMMMMRENPKPDSVPVILPPLETVDAARPSVPPVEPVTSDPQIKQVQATEPVRVPADPVARIPDPDLPPPPPPIDAPMTIQVPSMPVAPATQSQPSTVAPATAPSLTDEPPVAPKRFLPPPM